MPDPLASLAHSGSWPLWDQGSHFEYGRILDSAVTDALLPAAVGALGVRHSGLWEYDLVGGRLTWSGGVYDIFGLERGSEISREQVLRHYREDSRIRLEHLRAYALRHRRGFTLDVDVRAAAVGEERRMRIVAAPVCTGGAPVRLHGLKFVL